MQQNIGTIAEYGEVFTGLSGKKPHAFARAVEAQKCNEIGLSSVAILAHGLSGHALFAHRVQDVIGDLIGEAEIM